MKVYRIASLDHIKDLSGEGARLYGGRWNKIGDPMLYCSQHLSLCVLEILVHHQILNLPPVLSYLELEIDEESCKKLDHPSFIHPNWDAVNAPVEISTYGSKWLHDNRELALIVPSAVLPQENNVLINPLHPLIEKAKIVKATSLKLDARFNI